MTELIAREAVASGVPCNSCTLCCHGDTILIHEEFGDNPDDYQTVPAPVPLEGRMVAKNARGDCVYLKRGQGCSIYENRPAVCREFDCAGLVMRANREDLRRLVRNGNLDKAVVKRGKELLRRGYRPNKYWRR